MFKTVLMGFVHPGHELCRLTKRLTGSPWKKSSLSCMEKWAGPLGSGRTIVGLLLLKQMCIGNEYLLSSI
jgi:hypothetical protein